MDKRPEVLYGNTRGIKTGCGTVYITINTDNNELPFEVFVNIGKAGGCASAQNQAIGRLVSGWLRDGGNPEEIIRKLKGISCHVSNPEQGLYSCADSIAIALEKTLKIE